MGDTIFVESERVAKNQRKNKKRLFIVVAVVVALIIVLIALFNTEQGRSLLSKLGINFSQNNTKIDPNAVSKPTNMLNYEASKLVASGDTKAAIELYQKEIDSISNKEEKANRLLEISNLIRGDGTVSDNNKQQALEYAKQAEQLHPSTRSAALLYLIYRDMGNDTEAERYLKLRDERGEDVSGIST